MTTRPKIVDELKSGLEGVTPGPYVSVVRHEMDREDSWSVKAQPHSALRGFTKLVADVFSEKDAAHIARCSPDNISALIEWGEAMERERDALALRTSTAVRFSKELARAEAAEAKVAELEAKLAAREEEEGELINAAAFVGAHRSGDEMRKLEAENARLRVLFDNYGDHHRGCDKAEPACSCGMRQAYRTALAALDKGGGDA